MILRGACVFIAIYHCLLPFSSEAQSRKRNEEFPAWKYEIETSGTGIQGTYQIKVWSYMRNPEEAQELAMKNAVHGVIFKGFPDNGRIKGQRPLTQNPNLELEQAPFFTEFFKVGGRYRKFVALVDNVSIGPGDRIQVGKEYKIALTVSVQISALRKELEDAGIIKSLTSGF